MAACARVLFIAVFVFLSQAACAAQTFNGELTGTFAGHASDGSNNYLGVVAGQWTAAATVDAAGVAVENVSGSGTFGGYGLSGTWNVARYDAATKTIHVTWKGPGNYGPLSAGGGADGSVALVLDTARGVASGDFSGQVYTPQGLKTVSGTWTVVFQGLADTTVSGKVQGQFSGSATMVGGVGGSVSGDWSVRILADGSASGSASGTYDGGAFNIPGYGSICICGSWLANVTRGSDGQYQLQGSWTHPVVSGQLSGGGGGPIVWYLNVGASPMQASGNFDGQVAIPVRNLSIPVSITGNWSASLPINP